MGRKPPELPGNGLKVRTTKKMLSHGKRTEPWFSLIRTETSSFRRTKCPAVWSGPWSDGLFTPIHLVWTKLKSLKVRTKRGRCERALTCNFGSYLIFLEVMIGWIFAILTILRSVLTVVCSFSSMCFRFFAAILWHWRSFSRASYNFQHLYICSPLSNQLFNQIRLFLWTMFGTAHFT